MIRFGDFSALRQIGIPMNKRKLAECSDQCSRKYWLGSLLLNKLDNRMITLGSIIYGGLL